MEGAGVSEGVEIVMPTTLKRKKILKLTTVNVMKSSEWVVPSADLSLFTSISAQKDGAYSDSSVLP